MTATNLLSKINLQKIVSDLFVQNPFDQLHRNWLQPILQDALLYTNIKCTLHHLAADWYNRVSHDDYRLLKNWVNTRPEITWTDGMDPTQRQAITPAVPSGGGVSQPPGINNTITEIP